MTNSTFLVTTQLTIQDPYGDVIEGALISMRQSIGGTFTTISQKTTDATGQASFYLTKDEQFNAIIEKTEYSTRNASIIPTTNPYNVILKINLETIFKYISPISGVVYSYSPTSQLLNDTEQLIKFELFISSADGLLSYYGIKHFNNITNITTSPSGGTANISLNFTNQESVNITYFFKASNNDLFEQTIIYNFGNLNFTNTTNINNFEIVGQEINGLWKIIIIVLAVIMLLLVAYEIGLPVLGYGIIVTSIFVFFAVVGWISFIIPIVAGVLAVLSLISLGGGYSG